MCFLWFYEATCSKIRCHLGQKGKQNRSSDQQARGIRGRCHGMVERTCHWFGAHRADCSTCKVNQVQCPGGHKKILVLVSVGKAECTHTIADTTKATVWERITQNTFESVRAYSASSNSRVLCRFFCIALEGDEFPNSSFIDAELANICWLYLSLIDSIRHCWDQNQHSFSLFWSCRDDYLSCQFVRSLRCPRATGHVCVVHGRSITCEHGPDFGGLYWRHGHIPRLFGRCNGANLQKIWTARLRTTDAYDDMFFSDRALVCCYHDCGGCAYHPMQHTGENRIPGCQFSLDGISKRLEGSFRWKCGSRPKQLHIGAWYQFFGTVIEIWQEIGRHQFSRFISWYWEPSEFSEVSEHWKRSQQHSWHHATLL